jgi:hypothetical protein
MSGKGSKPRPLSVSQAEYDTRWDAIFGRDLKKEDEEILTITSELGAATARGRTDKDATQKEQNGCN